MACQHATPTEVQDKGQLKIIARCRLLQGLCLGALCCTSWSATDASLHTPWATRCKLQLVSQQHTWDQDFRRRGKQVCLQCNWS